MKPLRRFFDRIAPHFEKGGKYERFYPVYEVIDTFFYTPEEVTTGKCHVRDAVDLKRVMSAVLVALIPCALMAMYNTGYQANLAMHDMVEQGKMAYARDVDADSALQQQVADGKVQVAEASGWRAGVMAVLGLKYDPDNVLGCFIHGALYFLPIYIVCMITGILWEMIFCVVRGHELSEGFFVTGLLIPLIMPATIPLYQVVLATSFAVVIAKEIFGGTGRNFLNIALVARAYLFFAHAPQISGDKVWTAVDGYTGATPLGQAMTAEVGKTVETITAAPGAASWWDSFLGTIPGSMGETSTLACLIGAVILVIAGVASWRIMASMLVGALAVAALFLAVGHDTNPMYELPPHWHLVLGGFAFGMVFMATDPVTAAATRLGQFIYGALIGGLIIVVRVVNPGFPEGTMLAILLGNVFAPLIDFYVVRANIRRRASGYA